MPGVESAGGIDAVAHIIQVALTPVFLLSGIGTLLNMFNTRLSRVSDHTEHLTELLETEADHHKTRHLRTHLRRLSRRRLALDASILFGALGGAATCAAAFVLFLGGLRDTMIANWLVALFGGALGCTVLALLTFLLDSIMAWHGLKMDGPMPHAKTSK
jgi:hypothetical protein